MKLTTENVKSLTKATAQLGTAVGGVFADGQVTLGDLLYVKDILSALKGFSGVSYKDVLPELKDLDDNERGELAVLFNTTFDLKSDTIEAAVESGFDILTVALQALMAFVEIGTKVKAAA